MNRTYSHGLRPHQRTFSRGQLEKMASSTCFRTVWKKRDNHDKTIIQPKTKKTAESVPKN